MVTLRTSSHAALPRGIAFGDMPWDGIIGAAGNIVGSIIGSKASKYAANKQLEATRETNNANLALAKQQNDWNLQQWQRETAWDSTSAQLQRWKEAGLNPNSFAGVASPVQAPNLQSAEMANQQTPDMSALRDIGTNIQSGIHDGLSAYLEGKRVDAEVKEINQRIRESESRIDVNKASIRQLDSVAHLNEAKTREANQAITESKIRIEDLRSQIRLRASQEQINQIDFKYLRRTLENRVSATMLENELKKAGITLTRQQAKNAAEEYYNIVATYCLKANEINMLPFTNWITKTAAMSDAFKGAKESERANIMIRLYDAASTVLDFLSPGKGKTVGQSRSKARGKSAQRAYQRNLFGSHANPQVVLP